MHPVARHTLSRYYAVEALNALGATVAVNCVYFWTRHRFGYSDGENLGLGAAIGVVTVLGASRGGRIADRIGYDRFCAGALAVAVGIVLAAWPVAWRAWLFVLLSCYTLGVAASWPTLESAVLHARAAGSTAQRLGGYNLVWSVAAAAGFFGSSFLFAWRPAAVLWGPGLAHAAALALLLAPAAATRAGAAPAMEIAHPTSAVPRDAKRRFMRLGWLGNGLGYFLCGVLTPLLPSLGERLGLDPSRTIWLVTTLFVARTIAFGLLHRWEGWHYHAGWAHAGLWLCPAGFALVFFTGNLVLLTLGLAVFGFWFGLSYYASIFYSLDVGTGRAAHSGLHESMIGLGGLLGPLVGAAGAHLLGGIGGAAGAAVAVAVALTAAGEWLLRPRTGGPATCSSRA